MAAPGRANVKRKKNTIPLYHLTRVCENIRTACWERCCAAPALRLAPYVRFFFYFTLACCRSFPSGAASYFACRTRCLARMWHPLGRYNNIAHFVSSGCAFTSRSKIIFAWNFYAGRSSRLYNTPSKKCVLSLLDLNCFYRLSLI